MEVVDTLAPVIALEGEADFVLYAGVPYQEPGATAEDLFEGDDVTVSGQVDHTVPASYTLTYSAVDGSGNVAGHSLVSAAYPRSVPVHSGPTRVR